MDLDSAAKDNSEQEPRPSGQSPLSSPCHHYMTPPHVGSLEGNLHGGGQKYSPDGYSAAADPSHSLQTSAQESPHTEPPTLLVPGHLQNLYSTYVASYDDKAIPNSTRMGHAKSLALALLQHYYPKSKGFFVRPSHLGPMAKHSLNFMLKARDGSDPNYRALPPLKKGKNKLSKAKQEEREKKRQDKHDATFFMSVDWHFIEPEDIAGFEILKKTTVLNGDIEEEEYLPYIYLAIMIDDLRNFPFAETNDVSRGDILTDVLCRSQYIRAGYGILLFGPRLEFYDFDNGEEVRASSYLDHASASIDEPRVAFAKDVNAEDMAVDMREMGLDTVDGIFQEVIAKGVKYMNELVEAVHDVAGEEVAGGVHEQGEIDMGVVGNQSEELI